MKDILVSVIIPAYNAEEYMGSCLDSIISQTHQKIEIIVINDGSSDRTKEIAERYAEKDARIRVISTENGGVSRARNIGLDNSTGEFFTFVDADDGLFENAVECMLEKIVELNADMVVAKGINAIFGQELLQPAVKNRIVNIYQGIESIKCSLRDNGIGYAVWAKLYKRSYFKDIRFAEGRKVHEDSFYLFECFAKKPMVLMISSYVYRRNVTQFSASRAPFSDKFLDILYFADRKTQIVNEQFPELFEMTYHLRIKANMAFLRNLCKTYDKKYRKYEKQCIKEIFTLKKHFNPLSKQDVKWFKIITYNLYPIYKLYYWFRYQKREK